MTPAAVTASAADRVSDSLDPVTQKRVRHLPVLDGERLIGLVSIGDLVQQELEDHKKLIALLGQCIDGTPL